MILFFFSYDDGTARRLDIPLRSISYASDSGMLKLLQAGRSDGRGKTAVASLCTSKQEQVSTNPSILTSSQEGVAYRPALHALAMVLPLWRMSPYQKRYSFCVPSFKLPRYTREAWVRIQARAVPLLNISMLPSLYTLFTPVSTFPHTISLFPLAPIPVALSTYVGYCPTCAG